jgi:hypothetical protein
LHNQPYSLQLFWQDHHPFSICENVLCGINPSPHIRMPMIYNNLFETNLTNKNYQIFLGALHFNLKSIPFGFNFLLHLINYLIFITNLSCLRVAQNLNIHGLVVLSSWASKMSKGTTKLTYLHVKQVFVI